MILGRVREAKEHSQESCGLSAFRMLYIISLRYYLCNENFLHREGLWE